MTFGNAHVWGRRKQQISEGDQEGLERPVEQPNPTRALLSGAGSGCKARVEFQKGKRGLGTSRGDKGEASGCRRKPSQGLEETVSALGETVLSRVWGPEPGSEGF